MGDFILEVPEAGSSGLPGSARDHQISEATKYATSSQTTRGTTEHTQGEERSDKLRIISGPTTHWYFLPSDTLPARIRAISDYAPPVIVDAAQGSVHIDIRGDGSYNAERRMIAGQSVYIAINLEEIDISDLESITLSIIPGAYSSGDTQTIFSQDEIGGLPTKTSTLTLELQHRFNVRIEDTHSVEIKMDIKLVADPPPQTDNLNIKLLHLDTSTFQIDDRDDGPYVPFLWSIDVDQEKDQTGMGTPITISQYAVSGNGNFVLTLSVKEERLQLNLWDLELNVAVPIAGDATIDIDQLHERRAPFLPKQCGQHLTSLSQSLTSNRSRDPYDRIIPYLELVDASLTTSVSWDGSTIVLMSGTQGYLTKSFQVFTYKSTETEKKASSTMMTLTPMTDDQILAPLKNYCGFGKFHLTATRDRYPEDELFITCNGKSIDIYTVFGTWSHTKTIAFSIKEPIPNPRAPIDSLCSKYISWSSKNNIFSIYDLESSTMVCYVESPTSKVVFSSNGSMMAFQQVDGTVAIRWTDTGSAIINAAVSQSFRYEDCLAFLEDDARIITPINVLGAIMDSASLSIVGKTSVRCVRSHGLRNAGRHGQHLNTLEGSKLELVRLRDVITLPCLQPRLQCDDLCVNTLTLVEPVDELWGHSRDGPIVLPSGLTFTVHYPHSSIGRRPDSDPRAVLIRVSDNQGNTREALKIPPTDIGNFKGTVFQYDVSFDLPHLQMIVFTSYYTMVWRVPSILHEDFTLLLTWWTVPVPFPIQGANDFLNELAQCTHGNQYIRTLDGRSLISVLRLCGDDAFGSGPNRFLEGLLVLIEMFHAGDDAFRQHVLRYAGRYINRLVEQDGLSDAIMTKICRHVTQENQAMYGAFLKVLLDSPYGRWVPRPGLKDETNPIWLLLNRGRTVPRAIDIAQILIDYCIRMAKQEKDHHFLLPIMDSLEMLLSLRRNRPDIVLEALQKLVYIPARERSHIIDHAVIAHPPEFRLMFWKPVIRLLHECENPVLHLDRSPLIKEHDPQNDNFTRDLFVASFDMLWRVSGNKPDTRPPIAKIALAVRRSHSWIRTLFYAVLLQGKVTGHTTVKCHDFTLESFDNPAIAALVAYKWNTIGYTFWLMRFLWQCLYYILVLVAVFVQVYSEQPETFMGVFVAIIAMAVISLWLELLQAVGNPLHYITSPYNWVDVTVFALPLAGSVCQILNITNESTDFNTSTLSFSVLFVFLHFLFELRVNERVCQFVTIIIHIFVGIRVFFFVFAGGILAFAIAILHLVRACPFGTCDYSKVNFPHHLFRAVSSTYFFMGGIWGPVEEELGDDSWDVHIMIIIYYFFTTILLVNVLIALINNAFNAGDERWRLVWVQNRLRYVAAAESMSYDIPGFRDAYDWFPKEIYYSATFQEKKTYDTKYPAASANESTNEDDTDLSKMSRGDLPDKMVSSPEPNTAATTSVQRVVNNITETNQQKQSQQPQQLYEQQLLEQQRTIQDLKNEVQRSHQQMKELKDQLAKQHQSFEEQAQFSQMQMNMLRGVIQQQFTELRQFLSVAPGGTRLADVPGPVQLGNAHDPTQPLQASHPNPREDPEDRKDQEEEDEEFSIL